MVSFADSGLGLLTKSPLWLRLPRALSQAYVERGVWLPADNFAFLVERVSESPVSSPRVLMCFSVALGTRCF